MKLLPVEEEVHARPAAVIQVAGDAPQVVVAAVRTPHPIDRVAAVVAMRARRRTAPLWGEAEPGLARHQTDPPVEVADVDSRTVPVVGDVLPRIVRRQIVRRQIVRRQIVRRQIDRRRIDQVAEENVRIWGGAAAVVRTSEAAAVEPPLAVVAGRVSGVEEIVLLPVVAGDPALLVVTVPAWAVEIGQEAVAT